MCGIIAGFDTRNKASVNDWIVNQYEDQHSRGTQGFGILGIDTKRSISLMRATEPVKFMVDLYHKKFPMIVAHHRAPTSSDNYLDQTHPLFVSHESLEFDYMVVHNGVITNAKDLKLAHEAIGFEYKTAYNYSSYSGVITPKFNDSESLAIELARFIENKSTKIEAIGGAAFVVLQINKEKNKLVSVFFGRNRNPLHMAKTRQEVYLSSEGKGDDIEPFILYSFEPKGTMDLKRRKLFFAEEKTTYSHSSTIGYKTNYGSLTQIESKLPVQTEILPPKPTLKTEAKATDERWVDDVDLDIPKSGVLYHNPALDDYYEELTNILEEYFDELDEPTTMMYADTENKVARIRSVLRRAREDVMEQYAMDQYVPDIH